MSAVNPTEETYWFNGQSAPGIRYQGSNTGDIKYWFEGEAEESLFPLNNQDLGKFFIVFE